MKLPPTISFKPHSPGFYRAYAPSRPEMIGLLKSWPGTTYDNGMYIVDWALPYWLETRLDNFAINAPVWQPPKETYHFGTPQVANLYDEFIQRRGGYQGLRLFQQETAALATAKSTWMINFEMGLGKSATAIEILQRAKTKDAIIVCPAIVRSVWKDELDKWWPEHPEVWLLESGKDIKEAIEWSAVRDGLNPPGGIYVTSYELSKHITSWRTQALIFDEFHYCKNSRGVDRSKAARLLARNNPASIKLGLTGTPIANEPADLWNLLNILWPNRFGTFWQFAERYCLINKSGFASSVEGINPKNEEELNFRLDYCATRVTKAEVKDQLPALTTTTIRIRPKRPKNFRELMEQFSGSRRSHNEVLEAHLAASSDEKVSAVVDHVGMLINGGATRVVVYTYFHATAHAIESALRALELGVELGVVTGNTPNTKRNQIITQLGAHPKAILIATMKSVGVGINALSKFTRPVIAEFYYTPEVMSQLIGRHARLGTTEPTQMDFIVLEGTLDEVIMSTLAKRIADVNKVIRPGVSESALEKALDVEEESEESFLAALRTAAKEKIEEDEYV